MGNRIKTEGSALELVATLEDTEKSKYRGLDLPGDVFAIW